MFAAVREEDPQGPLLDYAVLTVAAPGPTWEMGERVGELESPVVESTDPALLDRLREGRN